MAYSSLFIDSDVILDLLFERDTYYEFTEVLLEESPRRGIKLNTSTLIIANINYLASKRLGKVITKNKLRNLITKIKVLPFEKNAVDFALESDFTDFEDAIQNFIATQSNCDAIITRNIKDYKHATIPVLSTEQFLRTIL
jgi:predicted nucleic acid-binding protein